MNYLMLSAGRRGQLIKDIRDSLGPDSRIIATDSSPYAPALYLADAQYLVPTIDAPNYIDTVLEICRKEKINAVSTFIDPEIHILAENRARFEELGVTALVPDLKTALICFNKYDMYKYLTERGIKTTPTWGTFEEAAEAIRNGELSLPVFVKPRTGSGSVGARKVTDIGTLRVAFEEDPGLIAQELMTGEGCFDLDVDAYVDIISHEPVAIFAKRKISTTIGGANKTISFKDDRLFAFVAEALKPFCFNGPIDADFFYKDGEYWLSEVNPRFGGGYPHAYEAGCDHIKLILSNLKGIKNEKNIGAYDEGIYMMKYNEVKIVKM
jgi:carbamoyl-phosphate synthase large subunit